MRDDNRFWILDPAGHRATWAADAPADGTILATALGDAVVIRGPDPDDPDDWVCDLCNEAILTRWGAEPFPVPMLGSNALCGRHFEEVQRWPHETTWGDPIPGTTLGAWPAQGCHCGPCLRQFDRWEPQILRAYGIAPSPLLARRLN